MSCPPPQTVSYDCSGAVYDRGLKAGMIDPLFKPGFINFSFSDWGRSLTYDVISKPPHGHNMPQIHNAANNRQFFS